MLVWLSPGPDTEPQKLGQGHRRSRITGPLPRPRPILQVVFLSLPGPLVPGSRLRAGVSIPCGALPVLSWSCRKGECWLK